MSRGLIVLLCRNALTYSRACLRTLILQSSPVEILVVDNASSDGTGPYMAAQQARYPNLYRMTFQQVTSVARCWNEALVWGWDRGHGAALVVNADTELLPETYERLAGLLEGRGMLTAVGVDGTEKRPSYPDEVTYRPHPDYSCFMIAREAHRLIPFDQHYEGAYFEDADHHVRMFQAGIWAGSINLGFLHHSSGTLKAASAAEQDRINKNYAHNKERFYQTYGCVPGTKGYEALFLEKSKGA